MNKILPCPHRVLAPRPRHIVIPVRGCMSVEWMPVRFPNPRRGFIFNGLQTHRDARYATPHGVVGHAGMPPCYRYGSPDWSHRLPHPSQSALAGQRIRFPAKRNGGADDVSAGGDDNAVVCQGRGCRMCSGRHPTTARMRKRHQSTHLHSVWPSRHTENACRCR